MTASFRVSSVKNPSLFGAFFLSVWLWGSWGYSQGTEVQLEIASNPSINFTADRSSFALNFPNFTQGSVTNLVEVNYSVTANNVIRTKDVVLAKLDEAFPNIALEAQFDSYNKLGGDAHLVPTHNGFVALTTQDVGLADKVKDEGNGTMLDGTFVIRYQAEALEDQPAGQHIRTLTVVFADT